MPVARNAKTLGTKQPRAGKGGPVTENVPPEKCLFVGRGLRCSPGSTPTAPLPPYPCFTPPPKKKQAHKNQAVAGKKDGVKAAPRKAPRAPAAMGVAKNNEINLKKSLRRSPPTEAPAEPEKDSVPEEPVQVPAVEDIDKEQLSDPYANAEYAKEIFDYMREREEKFLLPDYMEKQLDISGDMRAILVDWMVEVQ
ncbi:CCNB3 protein, partial [Anseranas semipalmata]|nr:CCNB3 protein [Anseranas semipalmata]